MAGDPVRLVAGWGVLKSQSFNNVKELPDKALKKVY